MTDPVRTWLVERSYGQRDLVTLVYATPDGERALTKEVPMTAISNGNITVTAATDAEPQNLEPVDDPDTVERYREEVERVRERNDPDEEL